MTLDHVDEIINHPALGPEDQVQVSQPDVEIDHDDVLPTLRQGGPDRGRRRRLADAALARCHHDHLRHAHPSYTIHDQPRPAMTSVSPLVQAWMARPRSVASISSAVL